MGINNLISIPEMRPETTESIEQFRCEMILTQLWVLSSVNSDRYGGIESKSIRLNMLEWRTFNSRAIDDISQPSYGPKL